MAIPVVIIYQTRIFIFNQILLTENELVSSKYEDRSMSSLLFESIKGFPPKKNVISPPLTYIHFVQRLSNILTPI